VSTVRVDPPLSGDETAASDDVERRAADLGRLSKRTGREGEPRESIDGRVGE
jgi:hypothetical protein